MERRRLSGWVLPSIGDVLFVSILTKTLLLGRDLLNDGDTGWHIATGMHILETFRVPKADIFSHTALGSQWTAHEWLSEVIFALAHKAAGLNGVVVMSSVVIGLTYFYMYRYMLNRGVSALLAAALTVLAAAASTTHWLARPHIFSIFLTLAFFAVLTDYNDGRKNRLWCLPALMLLWANLHAGFFLGLVLVLLYALSNVPASLSDEEAARASARRRLKKLLVTAAAVLLAAFVNPRGPSLLLFPFHLTGRKLVMDNVQEWASTNFHTEVWFELTLVVVASVLVMSRKSVRAHEGLLLLLLMHMSLSSVRFVPLFAAVAVPLVSGRVEEIIQRSRDGLVKGSVLERVMRRLKKAAGNAAAIEAGLNRHTLIYASIAICLLITLNGGSAFGRKLMDYKYGPDRFPVAAMAFAAGNHISGNMFNADAWGGYIIYKNPGYKVFFDGRYDMYSVELLKEYLDVARAGPAYSEVLNRHDIGWVLFRADSPLCMLLYNRADWKLVYSDDTARIFLRDEPENRDIINRHPDGGRKTT